MLLNFQELTNSNEPIRLRCSPIQLDHLLGDALKLAKENRSGQKDIEVTLDCDPIQIQGDEIRLLMAFNNLFENAIKFSPTQSHVSIAVAEKPSGGVVISIQDQGVGIPAEYYDKIFEPFFQVEAAMTRHHGGLGLGLAIVKGVIDLHGGQIEVKSKVGEGTRFVVELPSTLPEERCLGGGF
jgi:signal transduction histidine kinase